MSIPSCDLILKSIPCKGCSHCGNRFFK
ncbi:YgiT-type zinc finger protein [Kamptonema animale]